MPGILEWPERVSAGTVTDVPAVTSDYLPTILGALGIELRDERPMDGLDLRAQLWGEDQERSRGIGFCSAKEQTWIHGTFKIHVRGKGELVRLYDLRSDPGERDDLAQEDAERAERMRAALAAWSASCALSAAGDDYR